MATTNWSLDPMHSEIGFKIRHLMITNVTGSFKKFDAQVTTEGDDFTTAKINFSADIDSISTGNADRDAHLKNGDFFDAPAHPQITFVSTSLVKNGSDFTLNGDLTLKGVTKPVSFDVEFGGFAKDAWGNSKAGFTVTGKVTRADFGLTYNAVLETGGVALGEDVKVTAEIQLIKAA